MKLLGFDERPWLILCEGEGDKRFLDQLIEVRRIPNDFQVRFPDRARERTGGRGKFGGWLAIQWLGTETFRKNIKGVLVVSDNDEVPARSFGEVQQSLKSSGFPIPAIEKVVARTADYPPLVILMIPEGEPGSLETLCLRAAFSKWPHIEAPINSFVASTPITRWHAGRQAKAKLQAAIAATCEARPESGFLGHWWEHQDYHLPLQHAAFDSIEQFLRGFAAMVS